MHSHLLLLSAERGATIIYATHIFDGLESWPTHLAYVEDGRMLRGESSLAQ